MGWNSWNAFGSGNTEALTKAIRVVGADFEKTYSAVTDGVLTGEGCQCD